MSVHFLPPLPPERPTSSGPPQAPFVHRRAVAFLDTGEIYTLSDRCDRPVLGVVHHPNARPADVVERVRMPDPRRFARWLLVGEAIPISLAPPMGRERIDALFRHENVAAALGVLLAAGVHKRVLCEGPDHVTLELDPSARATRVIVQQPLLERAGAPTDWPPAFLDALLSGADHVALDPDPVHWSSWRGRPPHGDRYVRIIAARGHHQSWRKALRERGVTAPQVLPEGRRKR